MFAASGPTGCKDPSSCPDQMPRFYVSSPCFAIAKVWKDKGSGTVFININKTKKCDVSGCDQSLGMQSIDTPNYCYADEEYIWGENIDSIPEFSTGDSPSQISYYTIFVSIYSACSAGTFGTGATTHCPKIAEYSTIGILTANVLGATYAYTGASWKRQETGWGYWNYQKAGDICDNIDMIAGFMGGNPSGAANKLSLGKKLANFRKLSVGKKIVSATKKTGIGISDLCYGIQAMGDAALAWPIKTPLLETGRRGAVLNENCMAESASKCVWLEKCDDNIDEYKCPAGFSCIEGQCTKNPS
jgi:hypothetical protein